MNGKTGRLIALLLVLAAAGGAFVWWRGSASPKEEAKASPPPQPNRVASLGRIEPLDGSIIVAARSISGQPSIVSELRVAEGDWVKAGQLIAVLDSRRQMEAAVHDLEARVSVAKQRVAVAKTGGKQADKAAAQAEIARLQVVLADARADAERYQALYDKGSATVTERDRPKVVAETTEREIEAARARIAAVDEVRDVDVKLAESEVDSAQASVERARAEMQSATVTAPCDGRVIRIFAHKGEEAGQNGIVELARTDRMYVIAEVYDSDINRVRTGERASISGSALKAPLQGTVEQIGSKVGKDTLAQIDPVSLSDARVIEVKIRLDNSEAAAGLIHSQVAVVIEP